MEQFFKTTVDEKKFPYPYYIFKEPIQQPVKPSYLGLSIEEIENKFNKNIASKVINYAVNHKVDLTQQPPNSSQMKTESKVIFVKEVTDTEAILYLKANEYTMANTDYILSRITFSNKSSRCSQVNIKFVDFKFKKHIQVLLDKM